MCSDSGSIEEVGYMLKILVITTVKIGYDGLTNHIFSYIKNMDKSDIQVDLVSARDLDEKIAPQLNKVGFHDVYRIEYRDANQAKYFLKLRKLIQRNHYDIVHVHGNSATLAVDLLAAKMGGCKVRIAHSHTTACKHKIIHMCLKPLFFLCYTDGFACGHDAGRWLFGKRPFTVLPNGREIDKYRFDKAVREKYRRNLKLCNDTIAIGNIAAFVAMKNHKFIISVFNDLIKENSNYEMFLFGINGDTLESVKQQIQDLNLTDKIHYMGTQDNLQDYLQAMDLMVLPSLYEGFSSVIEWQINGLPCILSDTVTRDCDFLGNIKYLPINQGTKTWVDGILETDCNIDNRVISDVENIFTEAGFNIRSNSAELKKMYFEMVQRSRKKCGGST